MKRARTWLRKPVRYPGDDVEEIDRLKLENARLRSLLESIRKHPDTAQWIAGVIRNEIGT